MKKVPPPPHTPSLGHSLYPLLLPHLPSPTPLSETRAREREREKECSKKLHDVLSSLVPFLLACSSGRRDPQRRSAVVSLSMRDYLPRQLSGRFKDTCKESFYLFYTHTHTRAALFFFSGKGPTYPIDLGLTCKPFGEIFVSGSETFAV